MRSPFAILMFILSAALPVAAHATWAPTGAPLCIAANDQVFPTIVADGAGGAIVTWQDQRGADKDVYVQRVNAAGVRQWTPADGVALCTATSDQWEPRIAPDGAGGAIVTWYDNRGGVTADIYAQRVNSAGVVQWTGDGVALCTAADDQVVPMIVSDSAGGAIVTWHDRRSTTNYDIYAQRVDALGAVLWTPNGVGVCTATGNQMLPTIDTDGAGGAIITWEDVRSGGSDVYAQRINPSGVAQWTLNGIGICVASGGQLAPTIVADGAGGAIMAWRDGRSGARGIYARRVNSLGVPQWTVDGVALSTAGTFQLSPTLVSDGTGGAIVTWYDNRNVNYDIFARRVDATGVAQWAANGVGVCVVANDQSFPTIAPDGAGGAIITWNDPRSGTISDIYAQRLNSSGLAQWGGNGILLSTSGLDKSTPMLIPDGAGGAIFTWSDYQNGPTADIYAQHMNAAGQIPTGVSGPAHGPSLLVSDVYPNPFAGTATLDVALSAPSAVHIDVFDVAGRKVRGMTMSHVTSQRIEFDGRNDAGRPLASGVYFYRVKAAGETVTRKMVIAR